jgi:hypothetical protein
MRFAFAIAVVAAFISSTAAATAAVRDDSCPVYCYTNGQCDGCNGRPYCVSMSNLYSSLTKLLTGVVHVELLLQMPERQIVEFEGK